MLCTYCCFAFVSSMIRLVDSVHKLEVSSTQKMEKNNYSVFLGRTSETLTNEEITFAI